MQDTAAPRHCCVRHRCILKAGLADAFLWLWRASRRVVCTVCRHATAAILLYARAFAAGRTLMTLMRLFWRLPACPAGPIAMHFSHRCAYSATTALGVIAAVRPRSLSPNCAGFLVKHEHPISRSCPNNVSTTWPTRAPMTASVSSRGVLLPSILRYFVDNFHYRALRNARTLTLRHSEISAVTTRARSLHFQISIKRLDYLSDCQRDDMI